MAFDFPFRSSAAADAPDTPNQGNGTSLFDVIDKGLDVFKDVREFKLKEDLLKAELRQAQTFGTVQRESVVQPVSFQDGNGFNIRNLLVAAGVGIGVFFLVKAAG